MSNKEVVFILSHNTNFHSFHGGAVVRWVGEITSRSKKYKYSVIGPQHGTPNKFMKSKGSVASKIIHLFPKVLYDFLWCSLTYPYWQNKGVIIIENRPHYARYLRKLGFKGNLILHLHNDVLKDFGKLYLEDINKSIDVLLTCSSSLLDGLNSLQQNLYQKSAVIYNGVNQEFFRISKKNKDVKKILYLGRIDENKGLLFLLQAYSLLLKQYPSLELHIAGNKPSGKERGKYELKVFNSIRKINNEGGSIQLHGYLDHDEEVPALFAQMDVLCLSSLHTEAFPTVIVESMLAGVPIVAADFSGVREALGNNGQLYEAGNLNQLLLSLKRVLEDYNLRKKYTLGAQKRALQFFTWEKIVFDFEKILYEKI